VLAGEPQEGVLVIFFQEGLEKEDGLAAQEMDVIEDEAALIVTGCYDLATPPPALEDGFHVLLVLQGHAGAVEAPVYEAYFHG
jgi:hypothetical protein